MTSGGSSSSAGVGDVELLMKELGLAEEDLDNVVFDEVQAPPDKPRWIALAKVNTPKSYSQTWFYRNMRSAMGRGARSKVQASGEQPIYCPIFMLG